MGLRVGIAGFGLAGSVFHAPLIDAVGGLDVAAVMTRSTERAEQARSAYAGVRVVEAIDELTEAADIVVVATPNSSHVELALHALERGRHVVIDKPMAVTAEEARRVAEAGGGRVTVFHNRRWDGDFLTVRRLLHEGALGPVTRFESRFERFRPQIKEGWREDGDPSEGGGVLLDLGPHLVDQALQLCGSVESVYGEVRTRRAGALVDDDAFVALVHTGGAISHLWMSAIAPLNGPRFRVSGMRAGFGCDGLDPQEPQLRDGMRPGDPGFGDGGDGDGWLRPDAGARAGVGGSADAGARAGADSVQRVPLERGTYIRFYEAVRDWAGGDRPAPVDPADGVRVLEILEEARGG